MAQIRILKDGRVHPEDIKNLENCEIYKNKVIKDVGDEETPVPVSTTIYKVGNKYIQLIPEAYHLPEEAIDVTADYEGLGDVVETIEI